MTPAERLLARAPDWGRAPSAHNTQPWAVRVAGPDRLRLGWHAERTLPVGDPTGRDLLLSLGCVAEAMVITAADEGYAATVTWAVDRATRVAGEVGLGPARGEPAFQAQELQARRTARGPYAEPGASAEEVAAVASGAGLAAGARLELLPADLVAGCLPVADRWALEGPAAGELRGWLRLHRGDPRYGEDGLTDAALALTRLEAAALRLALRPGPLAVLRATGLTRALAASATARPLGTVVAFTAPGALDDDAVAELGRPLLRTWLLAGRRGLAAHPLSQLLDCPQTAARVADAVGPRRTAYAVFRLGRPVDPPPRSARLTDRRTSVPVR